MTAVCERLPTVMVSIISSPVLSRFRTSAELVLTSSMNPSRGPLIATSVGGSAMVRRGTFFVPKMSASRAPSHRRTGLPASTSSASVLKSCSVRTSGARTASCTERASAAVFVCCKGANTCCDRRSLSVSASAKKQTNCLPVPSVKSKVKMSSAGSSARIASLSRVRSPVMFLLPPVFISPEVCASLNKKCPFRRGRGKKDGQFPVSWAR